MNGERCPCGSGDPYEVCCGPCLSGEALPPTAAALMRSRYTAYTRGDADYLARTWHPRTRPGQIGPLEPVRWLGLDVRGTQAGGAADSAGTVEFVARYKVGGRAHRLHEVSRFEREGGRWYYVDGITA